ncbi:hypothetical protein ACFQX4_25090 [Roseomonas sp. GCM10028921]
MPAATDPIPSPLSGDVHPGRCFSLCGEALARSLAALATQAEAAGWHPREIAIAVMTWAVGQASATDGGEAVSEALMLSLDMVRMQDPGT